MPVAVAVELCVVVLAVAAAALAVRYALRLRTRQREYERALRDYRRLARHRLANPLTVIRGGIETLRTRPLPRRQRQELLDAIAVEAERLQSVALDPSAEAPEERPLRPEPERDVTLYLDK